MIHNFPQNLEPSLWGCPARKMDLQFCSRNGPTSSRNGNHGKLTYFVSYSTIIIIITSMCLGNCHREGENIGPITKRATIFRQRIHSILGSRCVRYKIYFIIFFVSFPNCRFRITPGTLNVVIVLDCQKKFTARIVVGTGWLKFILLFVVLGYIDFIYLGGRNVIQLARESEQAMRNLFRQEVRLKLVVEPKTWENFN